MDQPQPPMRPETPEETARRIAEAQRAHDRVERSSNTLFPAVASFAVECMKAAALINGGSAAAMLAFVGTGRQPVTADTIFGLKAFGVGLILSAAATAFAYLAQYLYLWEMMWLQKDWHYPFVFSTPRSLRAKRFAIGLHLVGILVVLAAFGCAAFGLMWVAGSLIPLPAKA